MTHTIYGLEDADGFLVYIGATTQRLSQRLAQIRFRREYYGLPKGVLSVFPIEQTDDWIEAEQFWIAYFRYIGAPLVNKADGGPGSFGYKDTPEAREAKRASGLKRRQSLETRRKISEANAGRSRPDLAERNRSARKLTDAEAEEIRSSHESGKALAEKFSITTSMVSLIRRGKRYAPCK